MSNMEKLIKTRIRESISVKELILDDGELLSLIEEIVNKLIQALSKRKTIFFAGNGGSYSDAIHLAAEFVSRFILDRDALPAIALGSNNSILTSIGNDYSFEDIFAREIAALGKKGDIFIALSTSGTSKNIINAINQAKSKGIQVYGFTGSSGGDVKNLCKCFLVPSEITARIQECHIMIGHIICEIVEKKLFEIL